MVKIHDTEGHTERYFGLVMILDAFSSLPIFDAGEINDVLGLNSALKGYTGPGTS